MDAASFDVLDTPLSSLVLVPRSDHERLVAEAAALRASLAEKDESLDVLRKNDVKPPTENGCGSGHIDHRQELTTTLLAEKGELEAKVCVLKSEIGKLRLQLQQPASPTPSSSSNSFDRPELERLLRNSRERERLMQSERDRTRNEKAELESAARAQGRAMDLQESSIADLQQQLNQSQMEVASVVARANELAANYQNLQAENQAIAAERTAHREESARSTQQIDSQQNKLRYLESTTTTLRKNELEYKTNLGRYQEENKALISKNSDLAAENSTLETQNNRLQKERIVLQTRIETLAGEKTAAEAELRSVRSRINGLQPPAEDIRQRLELQKQNKTLHSEIASLKSTLDWKAENYCKHTDDLTHEKAVLVEELDALRPVSTHMRRQIDDLVQEKRDLLRQVEEEQNRSIELQNINKDLCKKHALAVAARLESDARSNAPISPSGDDLSSSGPRYKRKFIDRPPTPLTNGNTQPASPHTPIANKRQRPDAPDTNDDYVQPPVSYYLTTTRVVDYKPLMDVLRSYFKDTKIEGLRGIRRNTNDWIVKFAGVPSNIRTPITLGRGNMARLTTLTSKFCPLCDSEHDPFYCDEVEGNRPLPRRTPPPIDYSRPVIELPLKSPRATDSRAVVLRPEPPQRSLFERIQNNSPTTDSFSPIMTVQTSDAISKIMNDAHTMERVLFCRFAKFTPRLDQFLDFISGGPVEHVRLLDNRRVGHISFVRPADAAAFLKYAEQHLNDIKPIYARVTGEDGVSVETSTTFRVSWSETPRRDVDREVAEGLVRHAWSRVLVIERVPKDISELHIMEHVYAFGGKQLEFFIDFANLNPATGERDLKLEFTGVRDCAKAYRKLSNGISYGAGVRWGKEGCNRPLGSDPIMLP